MGAAVVVYCVPVAYGVPVFAAGSLLAYAELPPVSYCVSCGDCSGSGACFDTGER